MKIHWSLQEVAAAPAGGGGGPRGGGAGGVHHQAPVRHRLPPHPQPGDLLHPPVPQGQQPQRQNPRLIDYFQYELLFCIQDIEDVITYSYVKVI